MICPSHGVIWRDQPTQIVEKYLSWAGGFELPTTKVTGFDYYLTVQSLFPVS
jgi:flavorubredoxin